ncbi:mucin-22 isoform X2 [Lutzomyia longipalpis]|uniref:mucin-22 isoform X2 n=1 Tax=Lutzomyia longipalpis TaxID=7200 RepID=UPI002483C80B|nr:mucin-22 isoform X2 [Lutzomyia longipalpis]
MAPSPELGQPKAPDKGDSSTASTSATATDTRGASQHDGGPTRNGDTAKSTAQDSENFENYDDRQLKALLDEAMTYKTPKDREHKSEAFKILLEKAEIQEKTQEMNYEFRASRTSGGSLQDLANPADVDFFGSSMNHQRKHHNSRQKKYSTTSSVSSRQREGGSLPSNVNVATNHLFQYEPTQPFLSEVKSKRGGSRKVDIVMYSTSDMVEKRDRKIHGDTADVLLVGRDPKHRVADDVQHLDHDSVQNHGDPLSGDDYEKNSLNKIPRASFTSQKNIDLGHHSTQVDKGVEFSSLGDGCGTKNVDMTPLQLNPAYKSVNSVVNPSDSAKSSVQASLTHRIAVKQTSRDKTDENGNSVNSFNTTATVTVPQTSKTKKKISKSERNTITKNSHDIDGFRGGDNIDILVRFIENTENTRKNALKAKSSSSSNGGGSGGSGNNGVIVPGDRTVKKDKKANGKKESSSNKLKKSNSMDELSSSSKLEEIARSENASNHENGGVTLRAKNTKKAASETTPLLGGSSHKGGKRGERRSWGTEELSYLGDPDAMEVQQPKKAKSKDAAAAAAATAATLTTGNLKGKKDEQQSLSVESMSATYEMAEFHVVTKKKKPKKRQNIIVTPFEGDTRTVVTPKAPAQRQDSSSAGQNRAKVVYNHQTSSHFANDRDVYVNDRRKSTSSVPPSEKSDSSDLDSVHSLPVESSTGLSLGLTTIPSAASSSTPPQASYADIARIANSNSIEQRFQLKDNWPAMPLRHTSGNQETMETASTNSGSTTASYKSQNSVVHRSVPSTGSSTSQTSPPASMVATATDAAAAAASDDTSFSPPEAAKKPAATAINGIIAPYVESAVKLSNIAGGGVQNMADVIKNSMDRTGSEHKNHLQKSKSVENDSSTYFGSIDHYPALEKTVKSKVPHHHQHHGAQPVGGKNVPNVEMTTKKSKSIVSSTSSVSCNNNNLSSSGSINCSANVSPNLAVKVSPVEQLKSPALVSSVNRCDVPRNGGASAQVAAAATVAPPTTTTTVNNNPAALNEDGNGGMTSSPGVVMPTKSHRGKKNDQKSGHQEDANATTARLGGGSSTSRPAVIILNDNDRYQLNEGITFGFDINNQLLFGDFNENELHLLEASSTSSSVPPTLNSCASSVTSSGQTATDTGYASNASTVASSEGHDTTLDTNNSSVQSASDATVSDQNFNHTLDDFMQIDEMEKCCDPMPILKACVSVQTSMEHLYINDAQPPSSSSSVVRLEERDSSIIASIPAQIAFTDSESNNNIIQMLSPSARICGKKLNVRYVAPAEEELILTTYNHDKIVSFVGLAWENVAGNDGVKYYDGQ